MRSASGFLDLPLPIREQIYSLCDLFRECPIDITPREPLPGPMGSLEVQEDSWENPIDRHTGLPGPPYPKLEYETCFYKERSRGEASYHGSTLDCRCPRIPVGLLLVSKSFSEDVAKALYGKNQFTLRAEKAADFTPLLRMNAGSLAAMTSLLVRLNCWPCRYGHEGDTSLMADGTPCFICSTPILEYGSVLDHASPEGRDIANQWNATCKRLAAVMMPRQLSLTLIADVANVETGREVTDSLRTLRELKQCRIRLGRQLNIDLQSLARRAAVEMTNTFNPAAGFPFSRLPKELRHHILSYSHLGTRGSFDPGADKICITGSKLDRFDGQDGNVARCCYKCTDTFADCCCPSNHAAYSATCACRVLPLELFLVDRQMREDAFVVFFSNAHFAFNDEPLGVIEFLRSLPVYALSLIQKMELRIQPAEVDNWNRGNHKEGYQELAVFMKENLRIGNLSVEIDSWWMFEICMWADEEDENRSYYDTIVGISEVMTTLQGIKAIKFKLGWFFALEPILERRILGKRFVERPETRFEGAGQRFRQGYAVPTWHKSAVAETI